jgi:hypothetical protein
MYVVWFLFGNRGQFFFVFITFEYIKHHVSSYSFVQLGIVAFVTMYESSTFAIILVLIHINKEVYVKYIIKWIKILRFHCTIKTVLYRICRCKFLFDKLYFCCAYSFFKVVLLEIMKEWKSWYCILKFNIYVYT